jgi:hypothetical protein
MEQMTQHPVSAERLRFVPRGRFFIEYCIYLQSTRGGGGNDAGFVLASSTSGPTSLGSGLHVYIFINGGEVCGRYADDAHLIRASVTASTSVVGSHSKLPSSVIILINGRLFSLGSRVCTLILTLQFWHHTNYHYLLVTYPHHAVMLPSLTNLGPVARLDCGEGQRAHACPGSSFRFQGRLYHGVYEVIVRWNSRSFKQLTPHPLTNG